MIFRFGHKTMNIVIIFILINIVALFTKSIAFFCVLCFVQLILGLVVIHEKGKAIVTFPNIFLVSSYIFHMYRVTITTLFEKNEEYGFWYNSYSEVFPGVQFYFFATSFLILGMALARREPSIHIRKVNLLHSTNDDKLLRAGLILFAVSVVPRIQIDIEMIMASLSGGYLSIYDVDLSGRGTVASFFFLSFFMILIAKKEDKIFSKVICIIAVAYEIVTMLSGSRFTSLSFIICVFYAYHKYIHTFKPRNIIVLIGAALLLSALLVTIRDTRNGGVALNIFGQSFYNNPLSNLLSEMGGTMNSLVLSIVYFPKVHDYAIGKTYLYNLFNIIPYLPIKYDSNYLTYVWFFPFHTGLGGSYLGELYFNFGKFGSIFTFFIGSIISQIELKSDKKEDNVFAVVSMLSIFYSLSYIRGYFAAYRIMLYSLILFVIIINVNLGKNGIRSYMLEKNK